VRQWRFALLALRSPAEVGWISEAVPDGYHAIDVEEENLTSRGRDYDQLHRRTDVVKWRKSILSIPAFGVVKGLKASPKFQRDLERRHSLT